MFIFIFAFIIVAVLVFNMHLSMCISRANYERNKMTLQDATRNTRNAINGNYTNDYRVDQMSLDAHIWLLLTFRNAVDRYKEI